MTAVQRRHTPREVADLLQVSTDCVLDRCRRGEWPHERIGRLVRFTPTHLDQIAALCEQQPRPAGDLPGAGGGLTPRSRKRLAPRMRAVS